MNEQEPAESAGRAAAGRAVVARRSGPRRAGTEPPPGSDPHPEPEPRRHAVTDNDERMRRDVPPHWARWS
ncbi:MAG: hypothetical protein QM635_04715 [Microbacteriaceae bacterium]